MRGRAVIAGVVVIALAVVGFLLLRDDDDGDDTVGDDAAEATEDAGTLEFALIDVPFTFDYPATFAPVDASKLPEGYLAILGIDPINFIDVRLTAQEDLSDSHIRDVIGAALDTETTDVIDESTSTVGNLTILSFEVSDTAQTEPTISRLNFLRAGGRTWELGCQSNLTGADVINDACDQMLETLALVED